MPQIGVTTEGYGQTGPSVFDYPKLEPLHKDEYARIFIPNPEDVWTEYRHSIGGQRAAKGLPPGSPIPGWGGNWICTGREEIMRASNPSLDPEACVSCRAHRDGDPVVDKPTRKFVTQVFRYATDPSGQALMQPFSVALKVWLLNDKEFGAIKQIGQTWGDLRKYDLLLKALSKEFKTWEVMPLPQALWATQPEWVAMVQQAYANQHVDIGELAMLIGRRATNDNEILAKIQEVKMAGQQPQGYYQPPPQGWPQPGQQMQQPAYFPGMQPPPPQQPQYAPQPPPELVAPPSLQGAAIPPAPAPSYEPPPAPAPAPPGWPQAPTMQPPQAPAAPLQAPPPMMPPPPPAQPGAVQPPPMAPPAYVPPAPPSYAPPPVAPQQQQLLQPPPMTAPPATQPPPAPNGQAPVAVDFTTMLGVAPPPPPPAQ